MSVQFLNLKKQYNEIESEIKEAIEPILSSQSLILGKEVSLLEENIARYSGTKFAAGVGSGTDAILLALMALHIGSGDEVITTPFTFFSTVSCIVRVGAKPVFADIDPRTFNIDPASIEKKITSKTKCIMPVHLYGQCADMEKINAIACKREIKVVEDAAQAIGAKFNGSPAGSMSDAGALSFYPTKNLGAFGEAGMVVTLDEEIYKRVKMLRVHGEVTRYYHSEVGINSRLDTLQAAVLLVKLRYLAKWTEKRRAIADRYDKALSGKVTVPYRSSSCYHVFNQYVIRIKNRSSVINELKKAEIGHGVYYPLCLHLQECFKNLGYREGDFPESELASKEVLALPIYPELTVDEQEQVIAAVIKGA
ncbi:MAG: DegT/DnrJ/EryC1/StrS family aminotransferase [Candidatus Schekmanbacteria bacterium]|nr:DegT/DnrJ/EryC1/StrS family aminotransferase [Candidatus Schekmanbacteria bacterium]